MFATTKLVRKLARYYNGGQGFGYGGTFTDKCKRDESLRHVAFRLYSKARADKLAEDLEFALFAAGYNNKVVRTSSSGKEYRSYGGEYVRVVALLG